jgi:hypothetical protein
MTKPRDSLSIALHCIAIAFGSVGEEVNCMKKKKDGWLKGIAECVERETEREAALNAIKLQLLNMGKVLVKALNEKLMPFDLFMPGSLLTWEPISILFFLSLVWLIGLVQFLFHKMLFPTPSCKFKFSHAFASSFVCNSSVHCQRLLACIRDLYGKLQFFHFIILFYYFLCLWGSMLFISLTI